VHTRAAPQVGINGNHGGPQPGGGGWVLRPNEFIKFAMGAGYSGARAWGRIACAAAPTDPTCANYTCAAAAGSIPTSCTLAPTKGKVTLFEIKLDSYASLDFYDISLVDAYNLPMNIVPVPGIYSGEGTP